MTTTDDALPRAAMTLNSSTAAKHDMTTSRSQDEMSRTTHRCERTSSA
jgi:hypothetical protein